MSITLSTPSFSFFSLDVPNHGDCGKSEMKCLPVYELQDLAFQVIATVNGADKTDFAHNNIYASALPACPPGAVTSQQNYSATWTRISTGTGGDPDTWVGYFIYFTNLYTYTFTAGTCFSIGFYNPDASGDQFISCMPQCFVKIGDPCYTSLLSYRSNESNFGFTYFNPDFYNKVRLPFYLHSPENAEEEKSYQKSDGATIKISHRIWKDYKVKTDYWFDDWHEKFVVATAHDDVHVNCNYSGIDARFVRTEKVEVDWHEDDFPQVNMAQAKTTLRLAEPRLNVNSNCI